MDEGFDHAVGVIELMDTVETPQWISIKERLPEDNKTVLVTYVWNGKLFVTTDWYSRHAWFKNNPIWWANLGDIRGVEVIAWMPLPEPYKEEENEKR